MIHIDKNVWNLFKDAPRPSVFEIFFYIALNQPQDGINGFQTTKIQLQFDLNSSQTSIFRDLKWLKDNSLIQELKLVDNFDFMANPYYVMNDSDLQARKEEWKRRCRLDIQRNIRLKQQRRIRELKKQSKQ